MNLPLALSENAMLYKDVTQWLRRRTFSTMFFGLLTVAEVSALIVVFSTKDEGGGQIVFGILTGVILLYLLTLVGMAFRLFADELNNRTFELFEMAGMSLERMIMGKLVSSMVGFTFGYFAVVPFIFFGYLLGGLDFIQIFLMTLFLFMLAPLAFLGALALAAGVRHIKSRTLIYGGVIVGTIFASWWLLMIVIWFFNRAPLQDVVEFMRQAFTGNVKNLLLIGFWAFVYVLVCAILFFLSCNGISRSNDSREGVLKGLLSLLIVILILNFGFAPLFAGAPPDVASFLTLSVVCFFSFLLMGLLFLYNRADAPIMAQRRIENSRGLIRLFRRFFAPGAAGTMRVLIFLNAVYITAVILAEQMAVFSEEDTFLLLPVTALFHLSLPACLFMLSPRARNHPPSLRVLSLASWTVFSLVVSIFLLSTNARWMYGHNRVDLNTSLITGMIASPISSLMCAGFVRNETVDIAARYIFLMMGVVGLLLCIVLARAMPRRTAPLATPPPRPDKEPETEKATAQT